MEMLARQLVWLGLILATTGYFSGEFIKYIALAEFTIGIVLGIAAVRRDIKGVGERAIAHSVMALVIPQLPVPAYTAEVLAWMQKYFALLSLMYVPATFVVYLAKAVKEGI